MQDSDAHMMNDRGVHPQVALNPQHESPEPPTQPLAEQPSSTPLEQAEPSKYKNEKLDTSSTLSVASQDNQTTSEWRDNRPTIAEPEPQSQSSDAQSAPQPTPPQSAGHNRDYHTPDSMNNYQIPAGLTPAGTVFVSPTGQLFFAPFQPCFTPLAQRTVLPAFGIPTRSHPMALNERPPLNSSADGGRQNAAPIDQSASGSNMNAAASRIPLPVGPLKPTAPHQTNDTNQAMTRSEIERRREELKHERDSRFDDLGVVLPDGTVFKSPIQLPDGRWKCWICDNTYKHAKHVRRHAQNHRKRKSFVCEFCSSSFNRNDTLLRHFYKCRQRHSGSQKRQRTNLESPSPHASDDDASVASQSSSTSDGRPKNPQDLGNEVPPPIAPAAL